MSSNFKLNYKGDDGGFSMNIFLFFFYLTIVNTLLFMSLYIAAIVVG